MTVTRELLEEAVAAREDARALGETRRYYHALARERVLRAQLSEAEGEGDVTSLAASVAPGDMTDADALAAATRENRDPDGDGDDDYALRVAREAEGLGGPVLAYGPLSPMHRLALGEAHRTSRDLAHAARRHRQALERADREAKRARGS